jgi:Holliday junction resolvasome RuvABC ATP-dependent DNA helicase subunit
VTFAKRKPNLATLVRQLGDLVGTQDVKESAAEVVVVKCQLKRPKTHEKGLEFKHTVFAGPPGTGKVVVARLAAEAYRELGTTSGFVEVTRQYQRHHRGVRQH